MVMIVMMIVVIMVMTMTVIVVVIIMCSRDGYGVGDHVSEARIVRHPYKSFKN